MTPLIEAETRKDWNSWPVRIQTLNPSKWTATDPRLRWRGYWHQQSTYTVYNCKLPFYYCAEKQYYLMYITIKHWKVPRTESVNSFLSSQPPHYWGSMITICPNTIAWALLYEVSAQQRPLFWQKTTLMRDKHLIASKIRTRNRKKWAAPDPGLRTRGHWGRWIVWIRKWIFEFHIKVDEIIYYVRKCKFLGKILPKDLTN